MPSTQLVGRFETLEVYTGMSQTTRPTGHLQVKLDKNGRTRSFWAFWRDRQGRTRPRGGGDQGPRAPRFAALAPRAGVGVRLAGGAMQSRCDERPRSLVDRPPPPGRRDVRLGERSRALLLRVEEVVAGS
jgi:hypothetical protein